MKLVRKLGIRDCGMRIEGCIGKINFLNVREESKVWWRFLKGCFLLNSNVNMEIRWMVDF